MNIVKPEIRIDGKVISTILTLPSDYENKNNSEKSVVILLHGGPGGFKEGPSNLFVPLSIKLAEYGIASIRFDFLGAGESDGDYINMTISSQVNEYRQILDYARSLEYANLGLLGESYGATIALSGLTPDVKVLTLLWPAVYLLDTTFNLYLTEDALRELDENGYISEGDDKIGRGFIEEIQKVKDVEHHLGKVNIPTLLIHGDSDSDVPHWQSKKVHNSIDEPKKLIIVPNGDHCLRLPHEQDLVVNETSKWFLEHFSSVPNCT